MALPTHLEITPNPTIDNSTLLRRVLQSHRQCLVLPITRHRHRRRTRARNSIRTVRIRFPSRLPAVADDEVLVLERGSRRKSDRTFPSWVLRSVTRRRELYSIRGAPGAKLRDGSGELQGVAEVGRLPPDEGYSYGCCCRTRRVGCGRSSGGDKGGGGCAGADAAAGEGGCRIEDLRQSACDADGEVSV